MSEPHSDLPQTIFVPTSIARAVEDAFTFAFRFKRAAVVTGPSGIGKSTALAKIILLHPNAVYGEARKFSEMNLLLRFITTGFGMYVHGSRSNYHFKEIIAEQLPAMARDGYYLLIDEMQDLSVESLREVVDYAELFRLPIVLVGNERSLRPRLLKNKYDFDQVLTRISKVTRLGMPTADDYAAFVQQHGVVNDACVSALAAYGQRASFRAVRDLLAVATEIAGDPTAIDRQTLEAALLLITDDGRSARLFKPLPNAA